MTNEEKARCIANANQCIDMSGYSSFEECENSALEMAEWKDQQFKEYLEKKRDALAAISRRDFYDISNTFGGVKCLDEIINELFREE